MGLKKRTDGSGIGFRFRISVRAKVRLVLLTVKVVVNPYGLSIGVKLKGS